MQKKFFIVLLVLVVATSMVFAQGTKDQKKSDSLEIFSWWTAGGEAEGLDAMIKVFETRYPGIELINATVAGGAGTNAKAVLATRMQGGNPPDTFQVHAGHELIDTWVVSDFMEPDRKSVV